MAVNVDIVDDFSLITFYEWFSFGTFTLSNTQLYSRQNAIVKRDPSLTVSRFKRYLNDTGIAVF